MGGHSARSCSVSPVSPPVAKAFTVRNSGTPNANGDYYSVGTYNGKVLYRRGDNAFSLWWDDVDTWILSPTPGSLVGGYWYFSNPTIFGTYTPETPYTGNPDVDPF